jgi:hypothetical protein
MRAKTIALAMMLAVLASLIGVLPVAADDASEPGPEPMVLGDLVRRGHYAIEGAPDTGKLARRGAGADWEVGDVVTWLALDDYEGYYYFKDFELMAIGTYGEVWVATDLSWPAGDTRPTPVVTQEQIDYLLAEFDDNMYPIETDFFGMPDYHDGSLSLLVAWGYFPEGYYDGDKLAIMIDNVRDDNYYDPTYPFYIAGFYSPSFEGYFDRNMMSIDAYDWTNRVGPDGSRPYLYEGVFAHEFQHLIHDDNDPDEELWVNEGMSMFAEWLTGYVTGEDQYDFFLDHSENSLVWWGDQEEGEPEILADYGIVYLWTLYLYEHFGGGPFIQALATSETNGIASVDETLTDFGYPATFEDVFLDFRVACLVDSAASFDLPFFPWGMWPGRGMDWVHPYEFRHADVHVNIDTPEAYDTPPAPPWGPDDYLGAPPWGTDYVKIADLGILSRLSFDGLDEYSEPTPWTSGSGSPSHGDVLWSGTGDLIDNWAIFEATGGGTLTLDSLWDIEDYWDFGFVQVSTDGGLTWTSLSDNEGFSTSVHDPNAHPKIVANLPGLTSWVDDWVALSYDLSAYAGQDILIAFRYVTDWATTYGGWWIDNVMVDGTLISDGSSVEPFTTPTELFPVEQDFAVTVVGMYERYGKSFHIVRDMTLNDLTEEGSGFLTGVIRNGGQVVLLVSLKVDEADAWFYGPYEYAISRPW